MSDQVRERARVTFPYEAQHSDELELKEGDIVTVLDKEAGDSGWWFGEINGRKGVFPDNFVTMLPPEKEKVKKKGPAPMPERPASGPKVLPTETKLAPAKAMPTKPPPPPVDSPMTVPPRRPLADTVTANAHPKVESPAPKPHPIAAPKPPKKVLPVPPKKPGIKPKAPPPKPSQPPEREEAAPPVVLRHQPSVEKKETTEGGFEDLKPDSGQKLTHITLSRPKNANRRPPSVFGGQGVNLSEAPPVENGTVAPPPRPKSSPIGPTTAIGAPTPSQTAKGPVEISPSPSPATSRPTSLVSDMAGGASSAQVEELKKEVKSLQEQLSSMRSEFKKEVVNLMTELDEEKKHRMAMQVELDRIKKLVLEKQ